MRRCIFVLALASLIAVGSCSDNPGKTLVGTWIEADRSQPDKITFFKDGTFMAEPGGQEPGSKPLKMTGTWTIVEGQILKLNFRTMGPPRITSGGFKINGDELSVLEENGNTTRYKRRK